RRRALMLGKRRVAWVFRLLVADVVALAAAFLVTYALRVVLDAVLVRRTGAFRHYLWLPPLILPVSLALLAAFGAYGLRWTARSRAWLAMRVSGVGTVLFLAGLFLAQESEVNRSVLALFALVSASALWGERELVVAWLRRAGRVDGGARVALVVGTGERARRI